MNDDEYTLMTTESMALVLNDDGCCVRHPSIPLKEVDEHGDVFLKEACPECQAEFTFTQQALLQKRQELKSQLNELNNDDEDDLPMDERRATAPTTAALSHPELQDNLSLESLAAHMLHIQQMQDILMFQKDKEVLELKQKVEQQQSLLTNKEVEIAVLKERMSTQKAEMEKELKYIKRAVAMDRERRQQHVRDESGGSSQEIHIEQLHVHKIPSSNEEVHDAAAAAVTSHLQDEEEKEGSKQEEEEKQVEPMVVAKSAPPQEQADATPLEKHLEAKDTTKATAAADDSKATTVLAGTAAAAVGVGVGIAAAATTEKPTTPVKDKDEGMLELQDDDRKPAADQDIQFVPTAEEEAAERSRVLAMAAKLNKADSVEFVPDDGVHPAHFNRKQGTTAGLKKDQDEEGSIEEPIKKTPEQGVAKLPSDIWQDDDDKVESEEEDSFDAAAVPMPSEKPSPLANRKPTPMPYKAKPGPLTTPKAPPDHPNDSRKDPLQASIGSLKPPGGPSRLQPPSDRIPSLDQRAKDRSGRNVGPIDEVEIDDAIPPMVPLQEQITIGSGLGSEYQTSDRFTPRVVADEATIGATTVGPTVASSTYGEDRVKVKNQLLLDPYGDKGIYTGEVLLSTGLPHGNGRMVYDSDDGRTYEGDWRHGRWNGWGRATFSNGDAFEGFYKYDQRHGHGKYAWRDGRIYEGEFKEDKRHGRGHFIWPDGAEYEGDFLNGQRHGKGGYTFADGGRYVGEWLNGRYEGYGECHWHDGRVYKGEWKEGMADGQGTETYPDGRVRHSGLWIKDEPVRDEK